MRTKHRYLTLILLVFITITLSSSKVTAFTPLTDTLLDTPPVQETYSDYEVTLEIDRAHIYDDRDGSIKGAGEIYFKVQIDSGSVQTSSIYAANSGETINLDWVILSSSTRSSFTIRVEVWEEDLTPDQFLGYVEYTRNPPITSSSWHYTEGSDNGASADPEAALYIIESSTSIPDDDVAPVLTSPSDITYTQGTTNNEIRWRATDENPDTYTIERDGAVIDSGYWTSGSYIVLDIDELHSSGSPYYFVIRVEDDYGNTDTDSVKVTVNAATTGTTTTGTTTTGTTTTGTTTTTTAPGYTPITQNSMDSMVIVGGLAGIIAIIGIIGFLSYSGRITLPKGLSLPQKPTVLSRTVVSTKSSSASKQTAKKTLDVGKMCPFCGSKNLQDSDKCSVCGVGI